MRGRERCDKSSKRAAPSGNIIAPIFINHIHASLISFSAGDHTRRRIMTPSPSVTAKRHTLPAGRKSAKGGFCSCGNLTSATDAMNTARHQTEATSSKSFRLLISPSQQPNTPSLRFCSAAEWSYSSQKIPSGSPWLSTCKPASF